MFYRTIEKQILNELEFKKPVLLLGARQVGKTTLVKKIGTDYGNYIYINLETSQDFISIIEDTNLDLDEIMNQYCMINKITYNENTMIIFDEIQFCDKLLTGLKYFYESGVKNKIIATGSTLGLSINKESKWTFPVGKVTQLTMYPLSFYEFLIASDLEDVANNIKSMIINKKIPQAIHEMLLKEFDKYIQYGGMPEVIDAYINGYEPIKVQKQLLLGYENDIIKYADAKLSSRIYDIYNNVDVMLNNDNQKYKLTKIDVRTYKEADHPISWLCKSNLVQKCNIIESITVPLRSHIRDNNFKLYYSDVGLLMNKCSYMLTPELKSTDRIYYGVIIENYFANVLYSKGIELFCYKKKTSEIDFIIQSENKVIPIEVKSGNNTKAKSLSMYIEKYNPEIAYKFSRNNISVNNVIHNYPVYALEFIEF